MKKIGIAGLIFILALGSIIIFSSAFTVHQTQQALILRFGEAKRIITEPGLHFKIPFADDSVFVDKRVLALDSESQEVIASDQKRLVVDSYARYKITDALKYYQSVQTAARANSRLSQILNSGVRRVLGESTFEEIVRDKRPELMKRITEQVNNEAASLGVSIVDVRIRRADLPDANSQAVYRRMQTAREKEANDIRARGMEQAQRITSKADRQSRVIIAEANAEAQATRGEGDAERNRLYAEAYGKDPEFFKFYRSMIAYEKSFQSGDTRLVISPESDFFDYFKNPTGRN
ncbi:protease modulator HflC [Hyphomicrobiales bacterium]|jgi:membrane protease subunit HflC|nr:protease modulator HflC [Rhodobiaceae bacterium]MBT5640050.1 protease modulator HflC [Rhodobiaceae bacterium]MDB4831254.1 protease modulator HflC [Hyphomicrobiales bacterium]MDC0139758.1 protease modulator HflC [Hyphomicrobiales bacterium]